VCLQACTLKSWSRHKREGEPVKMDTIMLILFGSLISTTSALTFMEVRRIRKKLQTK
jgi:hypothetical protein